MTATPMTDGANLSTRTTSRPLRTIRLAALAAIGIALLMALPLPALAGSNPAVATAADPSGHAAASGPSVWTSVLPLAVQEIQQHPEVSQALAHAPLSQRLDVPSHEGASSPTGVPAAAHPQTLSGNTYLNAPCSTTSALAAVNLGGRSQYALPSVQCLWWLVLQHPSDFVGNPDRGVCRGGTVHERRPELGP
jgi:hypothetical protein